MEVSGESDRSGGRFGLVLDAVVDLVANEAGDHVADFRIVEETDGLGAVAVHAVDDQFFELAVKHIGEVVARVGFAGAAHCFVGGGIFADLVPEELVVGSEVGSETLVDNVHDAREGDLFVFDAAGTDVGRCVERAALAGVERDAAFADFLQAVVFELDFVIEVQASGAGAGADFCAEETEVAVEFFELAISERDHLGGEGVEPGEGFHAVAKLLLLVWGGGLEALHGFVDDGIEQGVIGWGLPRAEEYGRELFHLGFIDDVQAVDFGAQVVEQPRVRLLRHQRGRIVVALEGFLDFLGLIYEIEDERVFFAGMRAIQAREGLHGLDVRQTLVDVHGLEERLVEAGLILVRGMRMPYPSLANSAGSCFSLILPPFMRISVTSSWSGSSGSTSDPEKATRVRKA